MPIASTKSPPTNSPPTSSTSPVYDSHSIEHSSHYIIPNEMDGATLASVALQLKIDLNEVLSLNHMNMHDKVEAGQVLQIRSLDYEPLMPDLNLKQQLLHPLLGDSKQEHSTATEEDSFVFVDGTSQYYNKPLTSPPPTSQGGLFSRLSNSFQALKSKLESPSALFSSTSSHEHDPPVDHSDMEPHHMVEEKPKPKFTTQHVVELKNNSKPCLCSKEQIRHIQQSLPIRYQLRDWTLLYSTREHGISLSTLYRKSQQFLEKHHYNVFSHHSQHTTDLGCVLLIETVDHQVLGAYINEPLVQHTSREYYGTGETFVFTFYPEYKTYKWRRNSALQHLEHPEHAHQQVEPQHFFIYASPERLAFGGAAIYMDKEFERGCSKPSQTFNSPTLTKQEDFDILHLEVWILF